ncbi:hypothetical protein [Thalassospira alkalitolerans]|uniref:hypothetical protein n=1 Tax=Thalassospira alkalitolerans TaxID=1293890 RepID=UPI003AA88F3D
MDISLTQNDRVRVGSNYATGFNGCSGSTAVAIYGNRSERFAGPVLGRVCRVLVVRSALALGQSMPVPVNDAVYLRYFGLARIGQCGTGSTTE